MIKTLIELVDRYEMIPAAMEKLLGSYKSMVAFDHCITLVGSRFLITVIIQLPKNK